MGIDLPLIWALIIGFGVMMYIFMDGFDLGIGILFPFVRNRLDRDTMVNTVAPVWDGNETWLVLGGAGLMAAFPAAYAQLLSALYLPLVAMLCGLIWRGVAFEFRFKAVDGHKAFWDKAFIWGSYIATLAQGISLGAFIGAFMDPARALGAGSIDWLTPFSLFTGVGLIAAYGLLGSTWLILKTGGELQRRMRALTRPVLCLLLAAMGIVSLWTPLASSAVATRWFTLPNLLIFAPVPVLVALVSIALFRSLATRHDWKPFVLALILVFLGYSGLIISLWPNIIPPGVSIWDAAAPPQSLGFALVGALFIIPFILGYTAWSYFVFRGKVLPGEEMH
ncbi:cytochrome d ubiquinol oxidase subunit II (plasmid) [Alloyangia pacifica]|uniref:Cytochrome d ubiquinol oxidase subunit II n=1 Tax=Alloyangia pacifica TaxID=311180 RepID=A0A2U8HJI1_9RHOB|nr:cytochrome d ubiquinol oxidase subunit II [Alloyangia pacifica]AWI85963.1 cytochrome d ubiquinol oxidase subunit II [Alloyangia pacifica]